ncbi:MAG TPA: right-handed parallel beta-helix repeat-containing protein, partial [Pseudonocardia sp.]|nr:right-handed parallel beta-helix repeat-containing protein [Pseudonocardia sp.]
ASQRAAEVRAAEAERLARAAAAAASRAAQLAAAGQRVRATWEARGRPARMVVVRDASLDLVTQGRLTRRAPRRLGPVTLTTMSRYLPRSWLTIEGGTAVLSAAVVLTPRVVLDIGGDVGTLKLAGGATLPEAAAIYSGSGRILLHGVTVTSASPTASADPASGQPAPATPGRPFIVVSTGGRLDATDVTVTDLGTAGNAPEPRPAISFHSGTVGSVVRTTFARNTTGLQLQQTQDVRLEDVTVTDSTADGLALSGDRGTTVNQVRAERNGGNGVRFDATTTDHPITGITTSGNGRFGVAAVRLQNARVEDLHTTGDASGGLELSRAANVTVSGLTAVDEPIGVFAHIGSTGITLDRLAVRGGRRGVAIEKTTTHLVLQSSTFDAVKLAGVVIGGTAVQLRDVAVSDTQTGVRIERGAGDVTAIGLRLTGGRDGVVATAGTTGVVLHDLSAVGVENDAVRSFSPDARILGGTIVGATTGVTAGAATTISRMSMSLVNGGIRARSPGLVRAEEVDIDAVAVGIDAAVGSPVLLTDSRVRALEAVRGELTESGTNELSLPPLNLLGAIGIPLVLLALVLELVHIARQHRGERGPRWTPPVVPVAAVRRSLAKSAGEGDRSHRSARVASR